MRQLALVLAVAFALAACGGSGPTPSPAPAAYVSVVCSGRAKLLALKPKIDLMIQAVGSSDLATANYWAAEIADGLDPLVDPFDTVPKWAPGDELASLVGVMVGASWNLADQIQTANNSGDTSTVIKDVSFYSDVAAGGWPRMGTAMATASSAGLICP